MKNKTNEIASTTEVKRGKAGDKIMELFKMGMVSQKKNKYGIPAQIVIFSVNDMW